MRFNTKTYKCECQCCSVCLNNFLQQSVEHLQRLFEKFVPKVLDFRSHHCKELIPTSELNSVVSLCVLFDALATEENGVSDNL